MYTIPPEEVSVLVVLKKLDLMYTIPPEGHSENVVFGWYLCCC